MRVCVVGGGCARGRDHYSGRSLLSSGTRASSDTPSQLKRALAATTIVIFVASVSYVVLSTVFCCLRAASGSARHHQPGRGETRGRQQLEETKRALEEIPVVLVQVAPTDPAGGGGGGGGGVVVSEERAGECAVCLAEYAGGEEVRVLPACGHGFHRECVDRWLLTRAPTCPVCCATVAAAEHAEGADDAKV